MDDICGQKLTDRQVIKISGEEAEEFLESLITCDVVNLDNGDSHFGGLLSPQGKILFDFFVHNNGESYLIDICSSKAEEFIRRMVFYRLRRKVEFGVCDEINAVTALWNSSKPGVDGIFEDPRQASMGYRHYGNSANKIAFQPGDYNKHRIALGVPQGGDDFEYGDAFPHEVLMDQFGGVDFKKGCFVGQEVVSRMQHRGTARKRIVLVSATSPLPEDKGPVTAGETRLGEMGSVSGSNGLALVRLDRVAQARADSVPILAGDTPVELALPSWVNYNWPQLK